MRTGLWSLIVLIGLWLGLPAPATAVQTQPIKTMAAESPARGVDFLGWRGGAASDYWQRRVALETELHGATHGSEERRRLALVRFHLAHREGAEALGHLEQLSDGGGRLAEIPLLRAIAFVWLQRPAQALSELGDPALEGNAQVPIWRLVAQGQRADWDGVRRVWFTMPDEAVWSALHNAELAEEIARIIGRAAWHLEDRRLAESFLASGFRGLAAVADARALSVLGRGEEALSRLADLAVTEPEAALVAAVLSDDGREGELVAALSTVADGADPLVAAEAWARLAERARADGAWVDAMLAAERGRHLAPPGPWRQSLRALSVGIFERLFVSEAWREIPLTPLEATRLFLIHRTLADHAEDPISVTMAFAQLLRDLGLDGAAARALAHIDADDPAARRRVAMARAKAHLLAGEGTQAQAALAPLLDGRRRGDVGGAHSLARLLAAQGAMQQRDWAKARSYLQGRSPAELLGQHEIDWRAGDWLAAWRSGLAALDALNAHRADEFSASVPLTEDFGMSDNALLRRVMAAALLADESRQARTALTTRVIGLVGGQRDPSVSPLMPVLHRSSSPPRDLKTNGSSGVSDLRRALNALRAADKRS